MEDALRRRGRAGQLRALRRLLYCGEWIESHALHVFMLHAPDFLGYASAIELARDQPEIVERALELKKTGNELMALVGGREIHPINVRVGGFYRAPTQARAARARRPARARARDRARDGALDGRLRLPRLRARLRVRRARRAGRVPDRPRARSSRAAGLDIAVAEYDEHFVEEPRRAVERAALAADRAAAPTSAGRSPASRWRSTGSRRSRARRRRRPGSAVRAQPVPQHRRARVELVYAADEALRLIAEYEEPDAPAVEVEPRRRRRLRRAARRRAASLPPLRDRRRRARSSTRRSCRRPRRTSARSRTTCAASSSARSTCPTTSCALLCEQTIRNYDPCISCATHFLKLEVERC